MGHKRKRTHKDDENNWSRELKHMKKKMRDQEKEIQRLKKRNKHQRSSSSSEEGASVSSSSQRSPLFPLENLLRDIEVAGTNKKSNQLGPVVTPATDIPPSATQVPLMENAKVIDSSSKENEISSDKITPEQDGAATNQTPVAPTSEATDKSDKSTEVVKDPIIEGKMLEAIGKRLDEEKKTSPAIHNDIFVRWKGILKEGLPSEERDLLFKKYPTPENCLILEPQKLNAQIKALLLEPIINKDKRLIEKQRKVCVCLSTLGSVLSDILKGNIPETTSLVATLSDTARVLVDLQRDESLTRRLIISANINPALKETLNATVMDEWLFGKDLDESLKTAKVIERTSKELKPLCKTSAVAKSKNSKPLPQQTYRTREELRGVVNPRAPVQTFRPNASQRKPFHQRKSSTNKDRRPYRK